jgi:alpha-D-xyloside xylohydrolase
VWIPFFVSSRGYGLLWNNPALGRAEFAADGTRFVSNYAYEIDYYVTTGEDYGEVMARYAEVTGHSPKMPAYGTGYWQVGGRCHGNGFLTVRRWSMINDTG